MVEDVEVVNCRTSGVVFSLGAVFRHMTFKGKCGKLVIAGPRASESYGDAFPRANEEYYKTVDWAIDISEAEFVGLELIGVPAGWFGAIRRLRSSWSERLWSRPVKLGGDLDGTPWKIALTNFLSRTYPDAVLVAPKGRRDFQCWNDGWTKLCDAGIARR